jgi:hypothetical protein
MAKKSDFVRDSRFECPVHRTSTCDCMTAYKLWSLIMNLPSYGLIAGDSDNPMISRKDVVALLYRQKPKQPTAEELGEGFC